jgi:tetratricopeptide (TPR) repeat protein
LRKGAISLNGSFDIRLQEGLNNLESGNLEMALRILKSLEADGFETPDLLEGIGRTCMRNGETGEAIAYFQKALRANPNLLTSRIGLGLCRLDNGEIAEGTEILKKTLESGKRSDGLSAKARTRLVKEHVRLGEVYAELGLSMEAVREYERAIRIGGDYPDIRRKMATEYMRLNLLKDAEREIRRALRRNPFYDEARADLGFLYLLKGWTELAMEEWSQIEPDGRGGGLVSAYWPEVEEDAPPPKGTDPRSKMP